MYHNEAHGKPATGNGANGQQIFRQECNKLIWHPLTLTIMVVELTCWAVYIGAAWRLLAVIPNWQPDSDDARQQWRRRALEMTTFPGMWTLALQAASFLLVVAAITNVWVASVPGAMCGTGVLQALGADGYQTLLFRATALMVLYGWLAATGLIRKHRDKNATIHTGRLLLLAAPFMAMADWTLIRAVAAADRQTAVNCCAIVYNQALGTSIPQLTGASVLTIRTWMVLALAGALILAVCGAVRRRRPLRSSTVKLTITALFTLLWTFAAFKALKLGVAPVVTHDLNNPCPWCLFLTGHGAPGFLLFGLPLWVAAESITAPWVWAIGRKTGMAAPLLEKRFGRSGLFIMSGAALFAVGVVLVMAVSG